MSRADFASPGPIYRAIKRLVDLIVSILGLLVLSPLLIAIAVAIRLTSPGPALYRGIRTGMGGQRFEMLKFRTMVVNAEKLGGPSTGKGDPRVTRLGRFLRAHKFDELPQLINVLRGQMSLVGPRPEVIQYTDEYVGEEKLILTVKPGITDYSSIQFIDLAEALGRENVDAIYEMNVRPIKNQLRVRYVKQQSFTTDMGILMRTLLHLLGVSDRVPKTSQH
ncbi:MAG TPA: sugar transferase [Thermoanaerobaculia bacterium]|nr:sugar transferase [Thermoanaerobaculia bacterium]